MKLIIDTTDKDNIKARYDNLNTQELGWVLASIVENITQKKQITMRMHLKYSLYVH